MQILAPEGSLPSPRAPLLLCPGIGGTGRRGRVVFQQRREGLSPWRGPLWGHTEAQGGPAVAGLGREVDSARKRTRQAAHGTGALEPLSQPRKSSPPRAHLLFWARVAPGDCAATGASGFPVAGLSLCRRELPLPGPTSTPTQGSSHPTHFLAWTPRRLTGTFPSTALLGVTFHQHLGAGSSLCHLEHPKGPPTRPWEGSRQGSSYSCFKDVDQGLRAGQGLAPDSRGNSSPGPDLHTGLPHPLPPSKWGLMRSSPATPQGPSCSCPPDGPQHPLLTP